MSSYYFNYLYPETKQVLEHHFSENYVQVLSNYLAQPVSLLKISKEVLSRLRQDLITLLGFSNCEFGIATTNSVHVSSHKDVVHISSNAKQFGVHKLDFEPIEENTHQLRYTLSDNSVPYARKIVETVCEIKTVINDLWVRASCFYVKYFYNETKNNIGSSYVKSKTKHLFYFMKDKNAKATEGNKNLYLLNTFNQDIHLLLKKFKEAVLTVEPRLNVDIFNSLNLASTIRYLSNPLWRDLNYPTQVPTRTLHVPYHRLKYSYDKYGSKGLRKVFFNTSSKAIQSELSKHPQIMDIGFLLNKEPLFNALDVNTRIQFLRSLSGRYNRYFSNNDLIVRGIIYLVENNFSFTRIMNTLNTPDRFDVVDTIRDISRYIDRISYEEAGITDSDNLRTVHDKLSRTYQRKADSAYFDRPIELTDFEKTWGATIDEYVFKVADNTNDLDLLGNSLNICVRSYDRNAIQKSCTIVGVYKDGVPFCCTEVRQGNRIVQSKLSRNMPSYTDKEFSKILLGWADNLKLQTSTYDIQGTYQNANPILI